ncbi:purine-nucleoside phosphorylase [Xaviernesmea oryzae]|uniref:Purine-nucleoside phosphorylase n=1 Tax=Xaviernesmea oryzae TaxID=464029 RepID=A0A1Q9ATN7_9HYPH|nr:DUF523 domain-containing protein [Xaviernesmea oryzae]OLP58711.1 purine-nucleoside phosphorylase [Xaviernesmea oryzae]SEK69378.1 Uncharacterized conserved protein YbbK, DUF523 family [Xaviernesmea oryzae]
MTAQAHDETGKAKILVSACLLGHAVRYDGTAKPLLHPLLARWQAEGRLVTLCPEVSAGLPVPRPPAEIEPGASGVDVIAGTARVLEKTGGDATAAFLQAADNALALVVRTGCRYALLIDGSPSCGSIAIYDGRFEGHKQPGEGVVAARLRQAGIAVYAHSQIEDLARALERETQG